MENPARFRLETCFDLALFALGIAIVWVSWGYGLGSLARPGPGLYPVFVGAAISLCAFALFIADFRSVARKPGLDAGKAVTLALMTTTFCLWIAAMPLLGYVVVTLLATLAFCKIMKLEGWRMPLAVSGATTLFIYLLFDYWLYVDLPRGLLG